MSLNPKILFLFCLAILLAVFFLLFDFDWDIHYILAKRFTRLVTIILASICIAYSSVIFQTVTANRILVPSVLGYESIYLFII